MARCVNGGATGGPIIQGKDGDHRPACGQEGAA